MTRTITFNADEARNQKRFEFIIGAMLLGGNHEQQSSRGSIEVLRREARILNVLDAISDPNPDPQAPKLANNEPARTVRANAVMELDQPDFELLRKRLEETPWMPKVARDVVDAVDWLSAAEKVEG